MEQFIPYVKAVGRGEKLKRDLTYDEARDALRLIVNGTATPAQAGAFLISQRVKGECVDEVRGFTDVIREEFLTQIRPSVTDLLDLATPHDGKAKTAQLAPAVAFTLVAAGIPTLLHGDEGVATKEGITPSIVLREMGVQSDLQPSDVEKMIEATGFGYAGMAQFAPAYHALLPLRLQFGLRTLLNTVEKFFNPADAPYQVSGFFHANYIERIRECMTGTKQSWMVQGEEGSVELAVGRKSPIFAADSSADVVLNPAEIGLGMERVRLETTKLLAPHVALNWAVVNGEMGEDVRNQVVQSAGTIFYLLGRASSIVDGIEQAQTLLANGSVAQTFGRIQSYTP